MREIALKNKLNTCDGKCYASQFNLGFSQHITTYNINYALMQHVSTRSNHHQTTLKPY